MWISSWRRELNLVLVPIPVLVLDMIPTSLSDMSDESQQLVFDRADCAVSGALVDQVNGAKKRPRWGSQAGNVVNGVIGPKVLDQLRAVTVTHVPTGISVTEDRHQPYRNKEIALIKLEGLVNDFIKSLDLD